jgi:hypothetical protein
VISIGKLIRKNDAPEEVEQIFSTMTKYDHNKNRTSGSAQRIGGKRPVEEAI